MQAPAMRRATLARQTLSMPRRQAVRSSQTSSSRPQILNQVVEFILGQVVGAAVLVFRVVDRPNLFQRSRGAVVQIRCGESNFSQRRRLEKVPIVGGLACSHVEELLVGALRAAVAVNAAVVFRNRLAELV